MTWFDILLIFAVVVILILGVAMAIWMAKDFEFGACIGAVVVTAVLIVVILTPVIVIDPHSGYTVGEITSVDRNTFGSTSVYIKTTNNKEEKYCVETDEKAEEAASLIGKKVKISYGKRVGIYSMSKCDQSPIEKFEEISE